MTNDSMLLLDGIDSGYGALNVLHSVSLEVKRGEIVSLLGANGAGKSTTLMCTTRIRPIRAGKILFNGADISSDQAHELVPKGMSLVPEGRRIFIRLTVLDNLLLGAYTKSDQPWIEKSLEKVFTLFPILAERRKQLGGTLSGGEQQMLAIGRALMSGPKLLLLDEPSMGIAPLLVQKIFESLKKLNTEDGLTILLVEQNAHLALALASRAYVMETGKIVLSGPGSELAKDPRIQEAYLGA